MRPDTGKIEIFLSLDFNAGGCRLVGEKKMEWVLKDITAFYQTT